MFAEIDFYKPEELTEEMFSNVIEKMPMSMIRHLYYNHVMPGYLAKGTYGCWNIHNHFDTYCRSHKVVTTQPFPQHELKGVGVCDSYLQVWEKYWEELHAEDRYFIIQIMPVRKSTQPVENGWRWAAWGTYIGNQLPLAEYLKDEPLIEEVFVYSILEVAPK